MFKHGLNKQPVDENDAQKKANLELRNAARKEFAVTRRVALVERKPNVRQPINKASKPDGRKKLAFSAARFGGGNFLVSIDCADDIDRYMRHIELGYQLPENFLNGIKGVDGRMRQILVDWLFHVQSRFDLLNETLSLTVNILDRSLYALKSSVDKGNLQLLGITCLFTASKFEEITVPNVEDFVHVAGRGFSKEDVFRMEQQVLTAIDFDLGTPHALQFLRRYRFFVDPDTRTYNLAKFISEVALVCYDLAHHSPSTIAATAIWLASYTFGRPLLSANLFTEIFKLDQEFLISTARSFVDYMVQLADPNEQRFYALREKYQESALDELTDSHVNRLRELSDFGCLES